MKTQLKAPRFKIVAQPTETTCGPTCLHAVYNYWNDGISLDEIISSIPENEDGGTYSVILANHALRRGYDATIYSYNWRVFDPTWAKLDTPCLQDKIQQRLDAVKSNSGRVNLRAYMEFLELGGRMRFEELTTPQLAKLLRKGKPIVAGLNSTHLYRNARTNRKGKDDDIKGKVEGHFVTLFGYSKSADKVSVADPYRKNPLSDNLLYAVDSQRLINAIMLGIMTYDANLLIIKKSKQ